MKKCQYCGKKNPDEVNVCVRCHAAFEAIATNNNKRNKPALHDSDTLQKGLEMKGEETYGGYSS